MAKLEYPLGIGGEGGGENPQGTAQRRSRLKFQLYKLEPLSFGSQDEDKAVSTKESLSTTLSDVGKAGLNLLKSVTVSDRTEATDEQQEAFKSISDEVGRYTDMAVPNVLTEPQPADGEVVFLYTPIAIQVDDRLDYQQGNLGLSGMAVLQGIENKQSIGGAIASGLAEGAKGISDLLGKISDGDAARLVAVRAAQGLTGAVIPDQINNAISLAAQATINPNIRTLFKGVQMRAFTFQFKFIPSSEQEAFQIESIINFFRYHAYPERLEGFFGYNYPELFDIQVQVADPEGGSYETVEPYFEKAYLTNISTTYNPTAAVYHKDKTPVETNMTLTFTEYRTLDRKFFEGPEGVEVELTPGDRGIEGQAAAVEGQELL